MLILTRKIDQSIIIAGNVTVMVLGVERDRVKIGIAAPEDVSILREELVERAKASNHANLQSIHQPNFLRRSA